MARHAPLDRERAWTYLLDLLSRRDYTEAELRARLRRRRVEEADANALLDRLRELGLANDERFTEQYVASRRRSRGRLALRSELHRKGVDPGLVARELEPLTEAQQVEAATALLQRFAWRYRPGRGRGTAGARPAAAPPTDADAVPIAGTEAETDAAARRASQKERARAFAFLARRGFTSGVVGDAVRAVGWWEDDT